MLTKKALSVKKAYILLNVVFLILLLGFYLGFNLNLSSYAPRLLKDTHLYLQAKILAHDSKELAKYFLYRAKKENKECLNSVSFHYPKSDDTIRIDYFYAIATCENFKFTELNKDANLSKDGVIIANISVALNSNKGVNEEIFINQKSFIYPKENFYKP